MSALLTLSLAFGAIYFDDPTRRLYALEEASPCWRNPASQEEAVDLLDDVIRTYQIRSLVVVVFNLPPNTGVTLYLGPNLFLVHLPETPTVSRWLVLHESAHVITRAFIGSGVNHGPAFRRLLVQLVAKYIDRDCALDFQSRLTGELPD